MKVSFGFMFIILGVILVNFTLISSVEEAFSYLYVSREVMEKNLEQRYSKNHVIEKEEFSVCNSFVPKGWSHHTSYRYIDNMRPSLEVGFFKNEYPVIINSIPFEKSQFTSKTNTVFATTGDPIILKLLIFENTGPQNIKTVNLFTKLHGDNFSYNQSETIITLQKDPPPPASSPIQLYINGGIREDPGQSHKYPNKLGEYSVTKIDPHNLISELDASALRVKNKMEVTFEITFSKPMKKSHIIITASDVDKNKMICNILDAWKITRGGFINDGKKLNSDKLLFCSEEKEIVYSSLNQDSFCLSKSSANFLVKLGVVYRK